MLEVCVWGGVAGRERGGEGGRKREKSEGGREFAGMIGGRMRVKERERE